MFTTKSFSLFRILAASWLGLVLVGCSSPVEAPVEPVEDVATEQAPESRDKFFDSDGVQIHYTDTGEGDPLVLIHGFAMNWKRMESAGAVGGLAERGYRVLAIDARGHGESDRPQDPAAYGEEIPLDVVRLIDHLGFEQAYVVGYSMGAIVANKVRARAPAKLRAVVMGGAGWQKEGGTALPGITSLKLAEKLEETGDFKWMLEEFTKDRQPPATEEEIEERNRRMMDGNDPLALAAVLRGWDGFAVSEENLRANEVPALVVVGANDPLKVKVDDLEKVMSNLEVVVIPDADHGALSHPDFVKHVDAFLSKHPLASEEPETDE